VLAFGSNVQDAAFTGIYILIFAMAVTLLAAISRKEIMRTTLCWMFIIAFGG
jgi:hypothetical protein